MEGCIITATLLHLHNPITLPKLFHIPLLGSRRNFASNLKKSTAYTANEKISNNAHNIHIYIAEITAFVTLSV